MSKNITFTADETLIDAAREAARAAGTTLNEQFRLWLESYARRQRAERAIALVERLSRKHSMTGAKMTRDELNARR